jgi:uncharacterized protein GlcG (DUF336 family)
MKSLKLLRSLAIVPVVLAVTFISSLTLMEQGEAADPSLTNAEVDLIIANAIAQAGVEPSLLRVNGAGVQQMTRMHVAVVDRRGKVIGFESMADAWVGSEDIARAKAYTAMAFSSDENALTSRTIGVLSQPGGDLWQIGNSNRPGTASGNIDEQGLIEFPGGLPLYDANGKLVGGIGVSGDSVCHDENVAEAGAAGFEPPPVIRVDTVLGGAGLYVDSLPGCP